MGIVDVPDSRLQKLADIVNPVRIVPATIEFVDIAGLVKGANAVSYTHLDVYKRQALYR